MATSVELPEAAPLSGIGTARPAFVHSTAGGDTAAPPIPTLNPSQFGAAPNWGSSGGNLPKAESALQLENRPRGVNED